MNNKMQNWSEDYDTQEIEGKKSMLFQVVDRIEVFKDRVEIIVNIKMDMHKNSPTSKESSNAGDVKCVSLVKKRSQVCGRLSFLFFVAVFRRRLSFFFRFVFY